MHRIPRPRTLVATGVAAVVLAGTGVAVADAATPSATPSPTPTTAQAAKAHPARARSSLHSVSTRKGRKGAFTTVGTQRGTITALTATSVTASSVDGFVQTYVLGPDTRIRLDKQTAAVTALKVGDKVGIAAVEDGTTWTAKRAVARS